jgi:hypothetical protein
VVILVVGVASFVLITCTGAMVGVVSSLIAIISVLAGLALVAAVVLMVLGAVMEGGGGPALATAGVVVAREENGAVFIEELAGIGRGGGGEIITPGADAFGDGILMSIASSLDLLGGGGGTSLCFQNGCWLRPA